ncbi:hypothetical protein X425_02185 [Mycobacterium avium XTB13-223]|nr:hypothetical protein X425_02185 [Mycobacterium avium XTB13-223]
MAEQRYQAVLAVISDGLSISLVAEKVGVSRQTLHAWLARYEASGLEGLVDRSHRPVLRSAAALPRLLNSCQPRRGNTPAAQPFSSFAGLLSGINS